MQEPDVHVQRLPPTRPDPAAGGDPRQLPEGLRDEHSGHDRPSREVSGKEPLVAFHIPLAVGRSSGFQCGHFRKEAKRGTVGQGRKPVPAVVRCGGVVLRGSARRLDCSTNATNVATDWKADLDTLSLVSWIPNSHSRLSQHKKDVDGVQSISPPKSRPFVDGRGGAEFQVPAKQGCDPFQNGPRRYSNSKDSLARRHRHGV